MARMMEGTKVRASCGAFVRISFLTAICLGLCGCPGTRGITKPRSEQIEEATRKGVPIRSVEEDRAAFYARDDQQRRRLMALIRRRSGSEDRDRTYKIGPLDEIEINVFDVPEMNVTAPVRQSGFIALPLVGAVQAAGLTEVELVDQLTKRLSEFVRNPQVSVFVSHYGSQKIAILGAVRKPGTYSLKKGANSLLELISQAGGLSEKSGNFMNFIPAELSGLSAAGDSESRARLALNSEEQPTLRDSGIEIYLHQVLGTSGGIPIELPVRGGDIVVVPEAGKVMIEGEVEKVGSYDLGSQLTMLGSLAAAGGITYGAKVDEIEVIREVAPGKRAHLVVDLQKISSGEEKDPLLRNGDIVRVPSDSGRRMTQDTFEGITKLINFGVGGSVSLGP